MSDPLIRPKKSEAAARHDSKVETVRRLLALAKSSNPHEAASAAAKAVELMHKYAIEQFEIDKAASEHESLIREGWYNADLDAIRWQFNMLGMIARVNFCRVLLYEQSRPPRYRLIGQPHSIEISMYIFEYLVAEFDIFRDADLMVWKRVCLATTGKRPLAKEVTAWERSFNDACALVIRQRLLEEFNRLNREARESTALIIYNDKAIEQYMDEQEITTRSGGYQAPPVVGHAAGTLAGMRRGSQIDLARHGIRDAEHATSLPSGNLRITDRSSL